MALLEEPLDPDTRRTLRRAVLHHAVSEHRRHHLPLLHVGVPGETEWVIPAVAETAGDPADQGLGADVVAALFARVRRDRRDGSGVLVWLTRPGPLDLQDVDACWLSAATTAAAEADIDLTMVVVNRHGWRDPRTGVSRRWKRLRAS